MAAPKTNSEYLQKLINPDSLPHLKKKNKDENASYFEKVVAEVSKAAPARQMVFGVSSGWICGFLAIKIGKSSALALGGGIIILQVASDKGFIKINWDKVNKSIDDVSNTIEEVARKKQSSWVERLVKFAENNTTFSGSFIGGFLIGLASH